MASIELRFLGDYAVYKDGVALALPPSRKTRALLAYLVLSPRIRRREQLCELLWEVPDDPRAALRWSLSKLRRLIDDDDRRRIVADRTHVRIDRSDVAIDVLDLERVAAADLSETSRSVLEQAAKRFDGDFLEGLELPGFHGFHGWCLAERERVLRHRTAILEALIRRLEAEPSSALRYARRQVELCPYDERARAALVRLLGAAEQSSEAEEQFQLGLRMLKEAGVEATGALAAARMALRRRRRRPLLPARSDSEGLSPLHLESPLLGRDEELSRLRRAFDEAVRKSSATLVVLSGAPGMGKSRLLEAVVQMALQQGAFAVGATAFESDLVRPYSIWTDALKSLKAQPIAQLLTSFDAPSRERLLGALGNFVAQASSDHPVVFTFDDVHWCDASSAAALHHVLRRNRSGPVIAVISARDGELRDNAAMQAALRDLRRDGLVQEIPLGPMPCEALSKVLAHYVPEADHERLCEECGGNPLLGIELARAERDGSGKGSLRDLVRERLSRMSVDKAEVTRWASVLRSRLELSMLAAASGQDATEVSAALEVSAEQGLLVIAGERPRFSHDLIAEAVYADISPLRRQVMHRRLAELLEKDAELDLDRSADLAHHAAQSGDARLAARAMVSVGRLCLRFFANADAQSVARQGLKFAARLPEVERTHREIELHDILHSSGPLADPDAAAAHYMELAERALDHGATNHARLGYHMASHVRWTQGKWSKARESTLQAGRATRGGKSDEQIIGLAETAKCLVMLERDLIQADAMLSEAEALARSRHMAHHAIPAGQGMLRLRDKHFDDAEDLLEQSRTLSKSEGDRLNEFIALEHIVMLNLQRGDVMRARSACEALLALGDRIREGSEAPFARALMGLCSLVLDDDVERLELAVAALRDADAKYRLAYCLTRAALVDRERGRSAIATERAMEALRYATAIEKPTEMLLAHALLASSLTAHPQGQPSEHSAAVGRLKPQAAPWAKDMVEDLLATA